MKRSEACVSISCLIVTSIFSFKALNRAEARLLRLIAWSLARNSRDLNSAISSNFPGPIARRVTFWRCSGRRTILEIKRQRSLRRISKSELSSYRIYSAVLLDGARTVEEVMTARPKGTHRD